MDEAETSAVLPLPANQLQETWRKLLPQATPLLRQTHCRKQGCNSSLSTWPWHVTEDRLSPFLLLGWHCPMSLMSLIQGRRKEKKHCWDRTAAFNPCPAELIPSAPAPPLTPPRQQKGTWERFALGAALAQLARFCQWALSCFVFAQCRGASPAPPAPTARVLVEQRFCTENDLTQPASAPPGQALIRALKPHRGSQINAAPNNSLGLGYSWPMLPPAQGDLLGKA